jgi:hypothetical protein
MKLLKALLSGFTGAIALNILHETVRRFDADAPRIDLLGEEALERSLNSINAKPLKGNALYTVTLLGDIISNGLYYSTIGLGNNKHTFLKGTVIGLSAGIGAIELPKTVGLDDKPVTKCNKTKILTVAWYLIGGLVTATMMTKLEKK